MRELRAHLFERKHHRKRVQAGHRAGVSAGVGEYRSTWVGERVGDCLSMLCVCACVCVHMCACAYVCMSICAKCDVCTSVSVWERL